MPKTNPLFYASSPPLLIEKYKVGPKLCSYKNQLFISIGKNPQSLYLMYRKNYHVIDFIMVFLGSWNSQSITLIFDPKGYWPGNQQYGFSDN